MAIGDKEKRIFPRLNFHSKIHYQIRGKPDFDIATTNDISSGGLRFTNDRFIPPATPVMLEISVLNRILRPIGRVAWSNPVPHSNRNQTGIEFIEVNVVEKDYLKDFINMQLG